MSERKWKMSRHAAERIQDMCIPPHVIKEVLEHPERTYTQHKYDGEVHEELAGYERKIFCKGKVALIVSKETKTIITVLWNTQGDYDREDLSNIWQGGGWVDY